MFDSRFSIGNGVVNEVHRWKRFPLEQQHNIENKAARRIIDANSFQLRDRAAKRIITHQQQGNKTTVTCLSFS